jgi:glyoxylase-like metal-dependent hydrolase (beta-lactamase superfamily II)
VFTTTGSVDPPAGLFGGSWSSRVPLEIPAFVIEHPRAGAILVGTGLSPALREEPQRHLGWLLARVARPSVEEGAELRIQLEAAGFASARVRRVILPDCRFPQTGGLSDFRDAEVLAGRADREWGLRSGSGAGVLREDLLAVQRWQPVDFAAAKPLGTLARAVDLLGDGSVWLLDVAGYTPGTMAVLVRLPKGPVVLAGGAVPLASTLRTPVVPAVATDADGWWEAAWRLKRLRELAEILVVPGFELSKVDDKPRPDVVLHRVGTGKAGGDDERKDNDKGKDDGKGGGMKGRRDARKKGSDGRSPADRPVQPRPNPAFPLPDPPATPPPMQR